MLKANNLEKIINGKTILNKASLTLDSGQIIAIVGPSGAGKTAFLRAISLVDFCDRGNLAINGFNYEFPLGKKNKIIFPYPKLTVVFQQFFIWPHLTVRENLILPIRKKFDQAHFAKMTTMFQMEPFLDRYPNEVSVGEKQRTALVRALLLKPRYLLLDEVTSALDIEQSYLILGHLREIAKDGVGIIIVSHALHLVRAISSHVIFLDRGEIIEEGTSDILANPKTARLKKFVSAANITN